MMYKRQWKVRIWNTKGFVAGLLILIAAGTVLAYGMFAPYSPDNQEVGVVTVSPDADPAEILETIEEKSGQHPSIFLKVALFLTHIVKKIEAGGYYVAQGMSNWDIFRSLANPTARYVAVAPGLRKEEIADHIAERLEWDTIEKREFVNAHLNLNEADLEGKYFPDTYLFTVDADPKQVAEQMVENYQARIAKLQEKYPKTIVNYDTAIIIASIIQREAAGPHDMRLVSGIIWNRLFKGMSLSMDATIQYARGKTEDGWWAPIEASDIRSIESPYNTYKNDGLPPTPISNPSLQAIEAALNPQKTACLYYIHDRYGQIHCSTTGEEHEANIRAYLR